MTITYVVGTFPQKGPWVHAERFESDHQDDPRDRQAQDRQAIATLCAFLAKVRQRSTLFADEDELQAVLQVLGATNPARFTTQDVLAHVRDELDLLDLHAGGTPASFVAWLAERSQGSSSITGKPMPNPWFDAQSKALWMALRSRGKVIDQAYTSERLLPLLCIVWSFVCAENTLVHEALEQERAEQEAAELRNRKPSPRIPRNTIPRHK